MDSSIAAVPDPVTTWTGRAVPTIAPSRGVTRCMSASIAALRWKIIGRLMASSTSGRTSVGPGFHRRPASITLRRADVRRIGARLLRRASLEEEDAVLHARAVRVAHREVPSFVGRRPGILPALVHRIEAEIEVRPFLVVEQ